MDDRSDDPSYHKRTLLPRSYISLPLPETHPPPPPPPNTPTRLYVNTDLVFTFFTISCLLFFTGPSLVTSSAIGLPSSSTLSSNSAKSNNWFTGRKELFYLTTHSTHYILRLYGVGHMVQDHSDSERGRKEGNVLFNDELNTFYLRLYGVRHMVKDHSDSERKEGKNIFI